MRRAQGWLLAAMVISSCNTVEPRPEAIDSCQLLSREALTELASGLPPKGPPTATTKEDLAAMVRTECIRTYGERPLNTQKHDEFAPEVLGDPAFRRVTIALQRFGDYEDGTGEARAAWWLKSYESSSPVGDVEADGAFFNPRRLAAVTGDMALMVEVEADNVNGNGVTMLGEVTKRMMKHVARDAIHTLKCRERGC
jgi:hypothetical protein